MTLASVWRLGYAAATRAVDQTPESVQESLDRAATSQRKLRTLLGVLTITALVAGLAVSAVNGMHTSATSGLHI